MLKISSIWQHFPRTCPNLSIAKWNPNLLSVKCYLFSKYWGKQEVKVIWQKGPHGGPIPRCRQKTLIEMANAATGWELVAGMQSQVHNRQCCHRAQTEVQQPVCGYVAQQTLLYTDTVTQQISTKLKSITPRVWTPEYIYSMFQKTAQSFAHDKFWTTHHRMHYLH